MALTTVALVKARLGIASSDTSQDSLLTTIVAEADDILKNYLGQNVEQATYTEYYSGNGRRALLLRQRPVVSITSIHLDADGYYGYGSSPFSATELLVAATDYVLDYASSTEYSATGIVFRQGTYWPAMSVDVGLMNAAGAPALGNIKVVYVAGWASVPARYQSWATKLACWKFKSDSNAIALASESISDTSYSYSLGDLDGMSQDDVLAAICGGAREWAI